ncbi:unannotated protein [freshwater metagenome]|uniref:Unannotated protein n=1 Tax=freshwater metagenome TaxID=449393 RepID=A0A6J7UM66_9ZZZZ
MPIEHDALFPPQFPMGPLASKVTTPVFGPLVGTFRIVPCQLATMITLPAESTARALGRPITTENASAP